MTCKRSFPCSLVAACNHPGNRYTPATSLAGVQAQTQCGNVHTWERALWVPAIDGLMQAYLMEQEQAHLASLHGIQYVQDNTHNALSAKLFQSVVADMGESCDREAGP